MNTAPELLGALKAVPEVLFVDVKDAGRSQFAAAFLQHEAPAMVHIRTAGTNPAVAVNPTVSAVLADRGLNVSRAYTKPLTDVVVRAADVVVTLGCADAVERLPGQQRYDWDLADPDAMDLPGLNALCDDIEARPKELIAVLRDRAAPPPSAEP
jgi:protein-tyrosine-phosphatase